MFAEYLLTYHKTDILQIMGYEDVSKHYAVNIKSEMNINPHVLYVICSFFSFLELCTCDASLGNNLLRYPESVLREFDISLQNVQQLLATEGPNAIIKPNIHTRVYAVPICPELHKSLLPENEDVGSFLQISGKLIILLFTALQRFHLLQALW